MNNILSTHRLIFDSLRSVMDQAGYAAYYNGDGLPQKLPEKNGQVTPYLILWAGPGDPGDSGSLCADFTPGSGQIITARVMCVGPNPAATLHVAQLAQYAMTTIDELGWIEQERSVTGPPYRDTTATQTVYLCPLIYRINTN